MELYISGGNHLFTNVDKRLEELKNNTQSIDAVFVEARNPNNSIKEQALNWLCAPFLLSTMCFWLAFLQLASYVFKNDQEIIDELDANEGVDVYYVDKPVHDIISDQRSGWAIANWAIALLPGLLVILSPNVTVLIVSTSLIVAGSVSLVLAYLSGVNTERNLHMVERVAEMSNNDSIDEGCIIVGKKHEEGIHEIASHFENIKVINEPVEQPPKLRN